MDAPPTPPNDVSRSKIYIFGSTGLPLAMISYPLSILLPRLGASDVGLFAHSGPGGL